MIKKDIFNIIFPLTTNQPWLGDKIDALSRLLFDECQSADEQKLVLSLLNRFKYFSHESFDKVLNEMVRVIACDAQHTEDNTIIVSTTFDTSADSGQLVIYAMKPIFQDYAWDDPKLINNANKIIRELPGRCNIIYVDEFIGTGRSILGRINRLKSDLSGRNITQYNIKVFSVACSIIGLEALLDNNINFYCNNIIDKGISDYYKDPQEISLYLSCMNKLENGLSQEFKGRPLPKLGYGSVEALYARQSGNSPNSVFPIFWWKFTKSGERRETVLRRLMGDA